MELITQGAAFSQEIRSCVTLEEEVRRRNRLVIAQSKGCHNFQTEPLAPRRLILD
jgi:hypothetical protein